MILDTSAILAILFQESSYEKLLDTLAHADMIACGTPTLVEASIVLGSRLGFHQQYLERFVQEFNVNVVPFGELHYQEAVKAYERYGKGRHPASLNFGDYLSYAVAKLASLPFLYIGDDFTQTDVRKVKL